MRIELIGKLNPASNLDTIENFDLGPASYMIFFYHYPLLRSANKSVHRPFSPYCASRARLRDDSNCFPQQDVEAW